MILDSAGQNLKPGDYFSSIAIKYDPADIWDDLENSEAQHWHLDDIVYGIALISDPFTGSVRTAMPVKPPFTSQDGLGPRWMTWIGGSDVEAEDVGARALVHIFKTFE